MRDETKQKLTQIIKGSGSQTTATVPKGTKKGNIMKNITANMIDNTLTVSKSFYKKASVCGSAEYYELRQAKIENPGFKIVFKTIEKKTYNGLTFAVMKAYIESQSNSEKQLKVFEAVKRIAEMKGSKYPLTKKWFLNAYPDFKENAVKENETNALVSDDEIEAQAMAELALVG